ncbi:MAG: hypothetical protein HY941_11720 [Gammaproteobacteria bacterium]|nr:hypothetical protein [Gammaproteobacteria bacterium]
MGPLPLTLEQLQEHLGELLAELLLGAHIAPAQENATPIVGAFGRVFEAMTRLDTAPPPHTHETARSATQLGASAYRLLNTAVDCLDRNEPTRGTQLALLHVGFAYWVARHGGAIPDLAVLVEHLARLDSRDTTARIDPAELTTVMLALVDNLATQRARTRTHDRGDPRDPWRLLHLHLRDAAQCTRRNDLIQHAHTRLLRHLPDDVAGCGHSAAATPSARTAAIPETTRETTRDTRLGEHRRESHKPTLH